MTTRPEPAAIDGVILRWLEAFHDHRGFLAEVFRIDDLAPELHPVMSYVSYTRPGVARGPHEHEHQTDMFCFPGPGIFELWLWDNRRTSPTFGAHQVVSAGRDNPLMAIVPPGVVHAYRNVSAEDGLVINYPNALYRGVGKQEPVDEIRHEDDPASPFLMEQRP